jgi:type III secretion system YscJ/HrcJ family lipoprotein
MRQLVHIFLFVILIPLVACKEVAVVHDLIERDANEIYVLLAQNDIKSSKEKVEKNQEVSWTINVTDTDEIQARSILVANNLPRVRHGGLEGICKDAGLILTPKTEKCREILAYKGEIINSLESIPGVVSADIVLNIPDKDEFPDPNTPTPRPTASVTVQYNLADPQVTTTLTDGKIQEFVANSVSGLDARDVAVIITYMQKRDTKTVVPTPDTPPAQTDGTEPTVASVIPTDLTEVVGLSMDADSAKKFKVITVVFLILFLFMAVAFIFVLLRMARLRKQAANLNQTALTQTSPTDPKLLQT